MHTRFPSTAGASAATAERGAARGFTLIELLAAVVIAAILCSIALPVYSSLVSRSKLRGAQNDLVALGLNMENYYQQQLSYPAATTTTSSTQAVLPGWSPAQSANFGYSIQASSSSSYTLKASGTGYGLVGYVVTLDNTNTRQQTSPTGAVTTW